MISRRAILSGGVALAATPALGRAAADAEPIHIPVGFSSEGRPFLSVTIDGKGPFRFAIDTGANTNLIKPELAKTLKLQFLQSTQASALGGEAKANLYIANNVAFGGILRQTQISVLALEHIDDYDGMLAAGFLTTFPSELDYGAGEIRLYPRGNPAFADYLPIPSEVERVDSVGSPRIFCQLTIDGIPLKVLVDTGAPRPLELFPQTVKANGLWDKFSTFTTEMGRGATGAEIPARMVTMPDLRIGGIHVASLDVKLLDPAGHQGSGNHHQGILGSSFLQNFSMAVTRDGHMALRPNEDSVAPAR